MRKLLPLTILILVLTACATVVPDQEGTEMAVDAPAEVEETLDTDAQDVDNPMFDIDIRQAGTPYPIEEGEVMEASDISAENPAPFNTVVSYENGLTMRVTAFNFVPYQYLLEDVGLEEAPGGTDASGNYAYIAMEWQCLPEQEDDCQLSPDMVLTLESEDQDEVNSVPMTPLETPPETLAPGDTISTLWFSNLQVPINMNAARLDVVMDGDSGVSLEIGSAP